MKNTISIYKQLPIHGRINLNSGFQLGGNAVKTTLNQLQVFDNDDLKCIESMPPQALPQWLHAPSYPGSNSPY